MLFYSSFRERERESCGSSGRSARPLFGVFRCMIYRSCGRSVCPLISMVCRSCGRPLFMVSICIMCMYICVGSCGRSAHPISLSLYIYIYIYIYTYIYIHIYVYSLFLSLSLYIYIYIYTYIHTHIYIYLFCFSLSLSIYIYIYSIIGGALNALKIQCAQRDSLSELPFDIKCGISSARESR